MNETYRGRAIPRGLLAEEVQHFLDHVELGISSTSAVRAAWFADQGRQVPNNISAATEWRIDQWHHRRVFSRLFQNVDQQNSPAINMILTPSDINGVFDAYRFTANGRLSMTDLINRIDAGGFRSPY